VFRRASRKPLAPAVHCIRRSSSSRRAADSRNARGTGKFRAYTRYNETYSDNSTCWKRCCCCFVVVVREMVKPSTELRVIQYPLNSDASSNSTDTAMLTCALCASPHINSTPQVAVTYIPDPWEAVIHSPVGRVMFSRNNMYLILVRTRTSVQVR
jgi:hypothetical protein